MGSGSQKGAGDRGYRVPPPQGPALRWPDAFGTRFTVFVDTEEEFDWGGPLRPDAQGTSHVAAIPAAHARFAALGIAPSYLIDHPIAVCPRAGEVLRRALEDGRSAVGTQLHPWVNPPFDEIINGFNSFAGNLPIGLEAAKLQVLTDAIERAVGVRPIAYRAGRYGIGPNSIATLARLGYRIDTSMRASYDYSREGGPDFSAIGNHAFRAGALVELPLTTVFTGRLRRGGNALHRRLGAVPRARGIAARLGLLSRVALTPEDMPLADALEAIRVAVGEGVRLLNFSFHSPSLEPGHTPYVRSAADLAAFYRWWDGVAATLATLGVANASLGEICAAIDSTCGAGQTSARGVVAGGL
ncbi:polysaccharide deacetylase family protein [Sphingomonas sp. CJ20]